MEKHVPKRMCTACRGMFAKSELIRLVLDVQDKQVKLDTHSRLFGRGAYVCKNMECINKAKRKKAFSKHFKRAVSDEIYDACAKIAEGEFGR